ncbi:MAG: cobalamin-binding protein [Hyphomicrobiales bacterium]|nr:cobalamin-binding protein [Hyphomicrobiales bacterium]
MSEKESLHKIADAVLDYDGDEVVRLLRRELAAGGNVEDILNIGLIEPMGDIGDQFTDGEIFVPEMLMAATAMKAGLEVLRPILAESDAEPMGKILLGTVQGDLHDIGKNLVTMMLEGAGFEVFDIGVNQNPEAFAAAVQEHSPDIVGLSALLTTTMVSMRTTTALLKEQFPLIKVIVGGAPVNQQFADAIGADGFSEDAPGAAVLARRFMEELAG